MTCNCDVKFTVDVWGRFRNDGKSYIKESMGTEAVVLRQLTFFQLTAILAQLVNPIRRWGGGGGGGGGGYLQELFKKNTLTQTNRPKPNDLTQANRTQANQPNQPNKTDPTRTNANNPTQPK